MSASVFHPLRVAFVLFGGHAWTGGINYLENLLSAVMEQPELGVQPVLFGSTDADRQTLERLAGVTGLPPVCDPCLNADRATTIRRNLRGYLLQRDHAVEALFRAHAIDVVFQHGIWLGLRFGLPTIAWIADFQHHHLPQMFPRWKRIYRTLDYRLLSHSATRVMVSSQDARRDCEAHYPAARKKLDVLPFVVRRPSPQSLPSRADLAAKYTLPERYLYLPNQFWRHKNHLLVIEALNRCSQRGIHPRVIASGGLVDHNNPLHPASVLERVTQLGLGDNFRHLGHIPYQDVMALLAHASALINPSLFEGWSTTVEEAKAMGVPLLLSDLPVHREQAPADTQFFDPRDPQALASVLARTWSEGVVPASTAALSVVHADRRRRFAEQFCAIVRGACE